MTPTWRKGISIFVVATAITSGFLRASAQPATTTAASQPATTTTTTPTTGPATTRAVAASKPTSLPALPATFPVAAAATSPAALPSEAEQVAAELLVRTTFADAYKNPAGRRGLATALLRRAQARFDPPAVRYVLLRESRDVSADAGDATGAIAAITELSRQFAVNAHAMVAETLERTAAKATTDADFAALASAGMAFVSDTFNSPAGPDDFAAAARLGMATISWAGASHDGALALRSRAWNSDVQAAAAEAARIQPAFEKLKVTPNDPEANTAVGRFRALYQNDWSLGLPLLAKGSDETLAALAKIELSNPRKQSDQLKLADAWWSQSHATTGLPKSRLLQRACLWYGRLYPNVVGPTRNHVERRLTEAGYTPEDLEELRQSP